MGATKSRSRGYVEQRSSGSYRAVIYAGIDPLTGKERYLRESAPTRKEAQAALARLQTKVDEKRHPRTSTTMGALLDQWMEVSDHDESTAHRYADLIRIYLRPTFGGTPAGKIDAEVLELFYARLRRCRELCSGRARAGHVCRPLAANTVRKLHFVVRAALGLGVRWRHLGVNEAEIARPPAFERHEPDPPSAEEAAALLNEAAPDPEWCLFLWLTMVTGTRRGEMCALRWSDLDLARMVLSITRATNGRQEKDTKTHQGRRLAIDEKAVEMLRAHRKQRVELCAKLGVELLDDGFVFSLTPDGSRPLRPATTTQRYRRLAERLRLRSTRLHSLRHYSATELLAAGVDIRTVAGRLGHGDGGATTLKVYAAWVAEADKRAAATMGSIVPQPRASDRGRRAPYEEVAAALRDRIRTGELSSGSELPPVADLAQASAVSVGTAQRAVATLGSEGLVRTAPGRRTTVV
ncbi:tyrosine-type recombinase/integrase [Actinomycetospora sp. CA-053990]|uniref:tyrosine-type recombinase/integrase n=1 Tax=Actinomycetospora sp. CA-053990 TaxID=3239891 RepID=UPI003D8DB364